MNQCTLTGVVPVNEVAVQDQTLFIFFLNLQLQLQGLEHQEQRLTKHPNSLSLRCTAALMLGQPGSPPSLRPTKYSGTFSTARKPLAPWSLWHAATDAYWYLPWWNHHRKALGCMIVTHSTWKKRMCIFIWLKMLLNLVTGQDITDLFSFVQFKFKYWSAVVKFQEASLIPFSCLLFNLTDVFTCRKGNGWHLYKDITDRYESQQAFSSKTNHPW